MRRALRPLALLVLAAPSAAAAPAAPADDPALQALSWRSIGPARGGRGPGGRPARLTGGRGVGIATAGAAGPRRSSGR